MIAQDWLSLVVVAFCLLLSALFSGGENALTACSRAAMRRLDKQGNARAHLVCRLLASRASLVNALALGHIAVTIVVAAIGALALMNNFGEIGLLYAVLIAIVAVALIRIMARIAASYAPDRMALAIAEPLAASVAILNPFLGAFEFLANLLLRAFGVRSGESNSDSAYRDEKQHAAERPRRNGNGEAHEREHGGILDLRELEVSDVMIHRTEMVSIDIDQPAADIVNAMLSAPHTRLPLWRGSPENIVGTLRSKDVLRALREAGGDAAKVDIAATMSPPWFVPDSTPVAEQLKAFRRRKTRFALVVDEYGTVEGLVTLDDIVGEILGDISDEHDIDTPGVRPQLDGTVHVDGSVAIRDLNRAMDWRLPDAEATTIAGLVIHEARSIPETGQSFTFHGFRFQVLRKARNRITALRVTPVGPALRPRRMVDVR